MTDEIFCPDCGHEWFYHVMVKGKMLCVVCDKDNNGYYRHDGNFKEQEANEMINKKYLCSDSFRILESWDVSELISNKLWDYGGRTLQELLLAKEAV